MISGKRPRQQRQQPQQQDLHQQQQQQQQQQKKPDPTLAYSLHGNVLIMAKTSSGKSTLLQNILIESQKIRRENRIGKKIELAVVNAKSSDYSKIKNIKKNRFSLKTLNTIPRQNFVIIEDVIKLSPKENDNLRTQLNYNSHHKSQKTFVVSHHVFKTSLFHMLLYFNYIIFTSAHANDALLRVILRQLQAPKEQIDQLIISFKSQPANYNTFYFYDTDRASFNRVNGITNLVRGTNIETLGILGPSDKATSNPQINNENTNLNLQKQELQERFEKFMAGQHIKNEASAVFSIFIECISLKLIRLHDLTLEFYKQAQKCRVSIVDYITALLSPNMHVNPDLLFLHRFTQKSCHIPKIFIVNKAFADS